MYTHHAQAAEPQARQQRRQGPAGVLMTDGRVMHRDSAAHQNLAATAVEQIAVEHLVARIEQLAVDGKADALERARSNRQE